MQENWQNLPPLFLLPFFALLYTVYLPLFWGGSIVRWMLPEKRHSCSVGLVFQWVWFCCPEGSIKSSSVDKRPASGSSSSSLSTTISNRNRCYCWWRDKTECSFQIKLVIEKANNRSDFEKGKVKIVTKDKARQRLVGCDNRVTSSVKLPNRGANVECACQRKTEVITLLLFS